MPIARELVAATPSSVLTKRVLYGYYACTRGHKARLVANNPGEDEDRAGAQVIELAGRYVAFGDRSCGRANCVGSTEIRDLATNRRVSSPLPNTVQTYYGAMVFTTTGVAAWTSKTPAGVEAHRLSFRGPDTILGRWDDRGGRLGPTSEAGEPGLDVLADEADVSADRDRWEPVDLATGVLVDQ